jgi:hypothetical protein
LFGTTVRYPVVATVATKLCVYERLPQSPANDSPKNNQSHPGNVLCKISELYAGYSTLRQYWYCNKETALFRRRR